MERATACLDQEEGHDRDDPAASPAFFGEVSGVDLRKPLTPQEAAAIEAGMDKYAVLLFPGQDISDEQQLAFARNFGERENARGHTRA